MNNEIRPLCTKYLSDCLPVPYVDEGVAVGRIPGGEVLNNMCRACSLTEKLRAHVVVEADYGPALGAQYFRAGRTDQSTGSRNKRLHILKCIHLK